MSSDLEEGIKYINQKYPYAQLLGIGTSMGANLMLKYAGESGKNCLLKGIVAVSTPFDLIIVTKALRKYWPYAGIPEKYLLKNLKKTLHSNREILANLAKDLQIDFDKAMQVESCYEFDELITCKIHGFVNPEEYYKLASCMNHMNNIQIPTLALSSLDDPVVTSECIPYGEFNSNPNLILAVTRTGGHVGWYNGV